MKDGIGPGVHQHRPNISSGPDESEKIPVAHPQVADIGPAGIGIRVLDGHAGREDEDIAGADMEAVPLEGEGERPGFANADQDQAAALFHGSFVQGAGFLECAGKDNFGLHKAKISIFTDIIGNFDKFSPKNR